MHVSGTQGSGSPGVGDFLTRQGFPPIGNAGIPSSAKRFPDGAQYRVEIPSVEGPACLEAVIEESERLRVRIHAFSQGSGVFLHTDRELDEMATIAAAVPLEVSLFARPNAGWVMSPDRPRTCRVRGLGVRARGDRGASRRLCPGGRARVPLDADRRCRPARSVRPRAVRGRAADGRCKQRSP